jgi:hypothetical protein
VRCASPEKTEDVALSKLRLTTIFVGLTALFLWAGSSVAAEPGQTGAQAQAVDNETCLACHSRPDLRITLPSEETLYLTIDRDVYEASVHGQMGYACVQCHTNITGFPHEPVTAGSHREFVMQRYRACVECHADEYEHGLDSVHQKALAAGDTAAAVCTDCHGSHDIQSPHEDRSCIARSCGRCHSEVFDLYQESVHGTDLMEEANPDVPCCIDCHEVHGEGHNVEGPSNTAFHLFSPQICAECHADEEMMGRYGISTDVFDTYVADFHGTTVQLFQEIAADQETNKPVCIDCHGVHDMKKVDDPESRVIKENLLPTCQRCHPDATANFPDSWTSHYVPSPEHSQLVYYVNGFYNWFFIPVLIGGMLAYVSLDGFKRIRNRRRGRRDNG